MSDTRSDIASISRAVVARTAFKKLRASDWIKPGEKVLLLNTGSGYKYLENIEID